MPAPITSRAWGSAHMIATAMATSTRPLQMLTGIADEYSLT
jgi:hypothetical protein